MSDTRTDKPTFRKKSQFIFSMYTKSQWYPSNENKCDIVLVNFRKICNYYNIGFKWFRLILNNKLDSFSKCWHSLSLALITMADSTYVSLKDEISLSRFEIAQCTVLTSIRKIIFFVYTCLHCLFPGNLAVSFMIQKSRFHSN